MYPGPDYTYELETYCPLNNYEINSMQRKKWLICMRYSIHNIKDDVK